MGLGLGFRMQGVVLRANIADRSESDFSPIALPRRHGDPQLKTCPSKCHASKAGDPEP